jgi:hypothetical protein
MVFGNTPLFALDTAPASLHALLSCLIACLLAGGPYKIEDLSAQLPGGETALWPLVCMAAVRGATLGAPLTAIVFAFAFGVTHDSNALLPVLTATLTAYDSVTLVMRHSIMTEKIARRGRHIYCGCSADPLERHHVEDVMTTEVESIDALLRQRSAFARTRLVTAWRSASPTAPSFRDAAQATARSSTRYR